MTKWHPLSICIQLLWELFSAAHSRRSERSISSDMEENSERQVSRWVEERLATLRPAGDWQTDTVAGFARLRQRRAREGGRGPGPAPAAPAFASTPLAKAGAAGAGPGP